MSRPALIETLEDDLARRIDAGQEDFVLLALHIGSGALALGIDRVDLPPLCPAHGRSSRACELCAEEVVGQ